jgi:ketopantoate reductase
MKICIYGTGAVVRYSDKGGTSTPVNRFIYYSLLPQERESREEMSF